MSRDAHHTRMREGGFPRVSGDEPVTTEEMNQLAEFSPRERG